ncbi:flagellar export chaperone FliS [Actinomycetaceae bacterium L2_0104]
MNDLRRRFVTEAVSTAGPGTLLVMLLDRLVLDLDRAELSLQADDRGDASTHLVHGQQIVDALRASLETGAWNGASELGGIYDYVFSLLVTANIRGDRGKLAEARDLIAPLREAWREAAASAEGAAAFAGAAAPARDSMPQPSSGGLLGVG